MGTNKKSKEADNPSGYVFTMLTGVIAMIGVLVGGLFFGAGIIQLTSNAADISSLFIGGSMMIGSLTLGVLYDISVSLKNTLR